MQDTRQDDAPATSGQIDYFGLDEEVEHTLPDGISFVTLKVLTEGDRRAHERQTSRDMTLRDDGATMRFDPGEVRHSLLERSIIGWNLMREGNPINFTSANLSKFLKSAPPSIIDGIYEKITEINAWLVNEDTVEAMEEERDRLNDKIREARERKEGKDD